MPRLTASRQPVTVSSSWRTDKRKTSERGYGWRWQQARLVHLSEHPLCVMCRKDGRITAATVVDHIVPHKGDEALFWDGGNWQSLCKPHHDRKTAIEDGGFGKAMTHPEWLPTPACPVVLVTGPSGAGKTTYCKERAGMADTIIDLDECFEAVCGVHGHTADRRHLNAAIRLRNRLLADLASKREGRAFFIVAAPSSKERGWWLEKLAASHVPLDPGLAVCVGRVSGRRVDAARDWYAQAQRDDWRHPSLGRFGDDGRIVWSA